MGNKRKQDYELPVPISKIKKEKMESVAKSNVNVNAKNDPDTETIRIRIKPEPKSDSDDEYEDYDDGGSLTIPIRIIPDHEDGQEMEVEDNQNLDGNKKYKCPTPTCSQSFDLLLDVWSHGIDKHWNWDWEIKKHAKCLYCSKKFNIPTDFGKNWSKNIKQHYQSKHPDTVDDQSKCNLCEETFQSPIDLTKHHVKHLMLYNVVKPFGNDYKSTPIHLAQLITPVFTESMVRDPCSTELSLTESLYTRIKNGPKKKRYKCRLCDKSFKTVLNLYNHSETHRFLGPFTCDYCELSFPPSDANGMILHLEDHCAQKRPESGLTNYYSCGTCGKYFLTEYLRKEHRQLYLELSRTEKNSTEYFEVLKCLRDGGLPNFLNPKIEPLMNVVIEPKFNCNHCSQGFDANFELWSHILSNHPLKFPLHCVYCNIGFETNNHIEFSEHLRNHRENQDLYICYFCSKTFPTPLHKIQHTRLHRELKNTPPDDPQFKELLEKVLIGDDNKTDIPETSNTIDIITNPVKQGVSSDYKCREKRCSKTFGGPSDLWNHFLRYHGINELKYKYCSYCNKGYNRNKKRVLITLEKHYTKSHYDSKNFLARCYVCLKYFPTREDRDKHFTLHKELYDIPQRDEKFLPLLNELLNPPNAIEDPGKKRKKGKLLNQKNTESESEIKPTKIKKKGAVKCPNCKKKFKDFIDMNQHLKATHSYQCPHCPKIVTRKERMKQHIHSKHSKLNKIKSEVI